MDYNKKSIWKWILLYLVIGAIAYGLIYYFFFYKNGYSPQNYQSNSQTQTQNNDSEIASWKTYKNNEYGFEIKIPDSWLIKDNLENKVFFTTNELENKAQKNYENCQKGIYELCNTEFIGNVLEFKYNENYTWPSQLSKVTLNQIEWTKDIIGAISYSTKQKDVVYSFTIPDPFDDKTESLLIQILSTFKFTPK
ncbi:MAG: hypothetical protein UR46_C0011G0003 [Parcubacteria group bacterium GW2011_GWA1_33_6]|uniref:PsbP C-terminal domain-containing protein n=1 Tax=Candidatus Staskawiczbacteria bacterium RIFCSPHIGHO2_02_FULL_33_16 TaxID=1802204 RepID=A0A1G2HRV2_9BACT|nr:MAG: hypothetical protein UR31_C0007G0007 [Parcubacteria group bacterium GW2011_GWA2_33_14]KKP54941.1 MAG: hypothetical protein UR46_C0011G0003 [Parcubacteria group bacterium GW2011_GWA1_33_6]OGZ65276.1 MAG: hypothetical protein A3D34_01740 [Candidatus Staskawiczbacteria bacterium RIFCSPHIGHO2_02_FULL_33_16]OGZ70982.1 MAG: hypothetical protein A2980_03175 [Candidatus Staskawiczbacteria bacterium RIFCSPLOWO2_01_FULL_33_13]